jgi:hypothetical protein
MHVFASGRLECWNVAVLIVVLMKEGKLGALASHMIARHSARAHFHLSANASNTIQTEPSVEKHTMRLPSTNTPPGQ